MENLIERMNMKTSSERFNLSGCNSFRIKKPILKYVTIPLIFFLLVSNFTPILISCLKYITIEFKLEEFMITYIINVRNSLKTNSVDF